MSLALFLFGACSAGSEGTEDGGADLENQGRLIPIFDVRPTGPETMTIEVDGEGTSCSVLASAFVVETTSDVRVGLVVSDTDDCEHVDIALRISAAVDLKQPLGDREVRDAYCLVAPARRTGPGFAPHCKQSDGIVEPR